MNYLKKELRIGIGNQKVVATDDGDNTSDSLVNGNENVKEYDEKKKLLKGWSVVG